MINDFDLFCSENGITEEQKVLINSIRTSDPARRVRSGGKNVPGFYSSKKMGLTIQFESHKLELCAIYLMEFDDDVYEFYDQPSSFNINYKINGRNRGHRYTADFFVISKDFIGWEEWKTEEELSKLIQDSPDRYKLDESGNWRCPPAEEYARKHGLSFRLRSSKEINWTLQNNIRFLEDYLLEKVPTVSLINRNIILNYVRAIPEISLDELLSIEEAPFTADDVYKLIILGEVFVDLDKFLITNFNKFPLFIDSEVATAFVNAGKSILSETDVIPNNRVTFEVGGNIFWSGNLWTVVNISETEISLLDESGKIITLPINSFEDLIRKGFIKSFDTPVLNNDKYQKFINIMNRTDPADLKRANENFLLFMKHMDGEKVNVPKRTLSDWKRKYLKAVKEYGRGFPAFIPNKDKQQGNHTRRLDQEVINLMGKYIEENYEDKRQPDASSVYNQFKEDCKAKGFDPPTLKTFIKEIEKRPKHEQDKKRMGTKAAYGSEPVYWELSLTTPRHGSRPFELAHIDHTELDIELICSKTKKNLGRPWLTLLIDAFSRRVLSFYLTFDPPSYRSCMMAIRECVKKFSRMPKTIIVDSGKDFQSVYFDTLLASNDCHKKTRPGAKPKFGSVCERLFGTTNTMFIYNLMGNTQMTKNPRRMSKEVNPKGLAIWTLEALYQALTKFLYDLYDQKPHTSLDQSPREAYQQNIKLTGERKHTYIKYDDNFEMLTLPTTKKGSAKVQPGVGVKINNIYYNSYELLDPSVEGKQVYVRFDPFDYSQAFAYVNNRWIKINSEYELEFKGRTQKEMQIATAELRKRKKNTQDAINISALDLAKFFRGTEAHELLELQRLRDEAVKKTFKVIEGGKSYLSPSMKTKLNKRNKPNSKNNNENNEKVTSEETTTEFVLYEEFF
jgi:putative transposase